MPAYVSEPEGPGGRRQGTLAVTFLILALATSYLPDAAQQRIAWGMRVTLLRPFLATQERLTDARLRASDVGEMRLQLDSLSSILTTQAALADENRTLRDLLGLAARVTPSFLPATVLRPGTPGSEGMFWVELGTADGIAPGAPVVSRHGLVGVIREVRETISVGMDSTHPDFRASAMLADGSTFGMVQARRGAFREADRLVFDGTPYHESSLDGTVVLTSGLSGVLPRGIPIGRIDGVEEVQGRWLKSYWLRPMVEPGSVTHVLVATRGAGADETELWAADSLFTLEEAIGAGRTP